MEDKTKDTAGYVYVLQCGYEIKIGKSKSSVEQRRKAVQTGRSTPVTIQYRLYVKNRHSSETFLHNVFMKYHKGGEWFVLDAEGKALLQSIFEQTYDTKTLERVGLLQYEPIHV